VSTIEVCELILLNSAYSLQYSDLVLDSLALYVTNRYYKTIRTCHKLVTRKKSRRAFNTELHLNDWKHLSPHLL